MADEDFPPRDCDNCPRHNGLRACVWYCNGVTGLGLSLGLMAYGYDVDIAGNPPLTTVSTLDFVETLVNTHTCGNAEEFATSQRRFHSIKKSIK